MSSTESVIELGDSFARELPELGVEWIPATVPVPAIVAFNESLAIELNLAVVKGLDGDRTALGAGEVIRRVDHGIASSVAAIQQEKGISRVGQRPEIRDLKSLIGRGAVAAARRGGIVALAHADRAEQQTRFQ